MEKNKKIAKDLLKQIGIIFIYILLVLGMQLLFKNIIDNSKGLLLNLVYIFIDLITLIIFIYLFRKIIIPDFTDFKNNGKKYIKNYFSYYIFGLMIMMITNLIISLFIKMPTNEIANRSLLDKLPIYMIFNSVLFAPITEELMTRAVLKNTFKQKWIYYFLSGLIFGSLHMIASQSYLELLYIIPYGTLGGIFAKIYNDSNNIWTNIFFHAFHNFVCVLLLFTGISGV